MQEYDETNQSLDADAKSKHHIEEFNRKMDTEEGCMGFVLMVGFIVICCVVYYVISNGRTPQHETIQMHQWSHSLLTQKL